MMLDTINKDKSGWKTNTRDKADVFLWLEKWFLKHCDGEWEHSYGLRIETLDNPGWSLKINLQGTELAGKTMQKIFLERTEDDWISCDVVDDQFKCYGGPENLIEMVSVFKEWVKRVVNI